MHSEWLSNMRIYINSVTLLINSSFFLSCHWTCSIFIAFIVAVVNLVGFFVVIIRNQNCWYEKRNDFQSLSTADWAGANSIFLRMDWCVCVFVSVMSANNAITRCCFCVSLRFKSNYKHNSNAHHTSKPYVGGKNKIPITKERKISNSQQRKWKNKITESFWKGIALANAPLLLTHSQSWSRSVQPLNNAFFAQSYGKQSYQNSFINYAVFTIEWATGCVFIHVQCEYFGFIAR